MADAFEGQISSAWVALQNSKVPLSSAKLKSFLIWVTAGLREFREGRGSYMDCLLAGKLSNEELVASDASIEVSGAV